MINGDYAFSGFSVNDIQKAKDFYARVIGLEVAEEDGALRLSIGGGKTIFVYPKDDHVPAT
jgi:catechol-2,3-dioxygenase